VNLPKRFLEVIAMNNRNNNRKDTAILDLAAEKLFIFSDTDGIREYTYPEIKELYALLDPINGIEYDLEKVLG